MLCVSAKSGCYVTIQEALDGAHVKHPEHLWGTNVCEVSPHPLHWSPTNDEGAVVSGLRPTKFHNQLHCLLDIQGEIAGLAGGDCGFCEGEVEYGGENWSELVGT